MPTPSHPFRTPPRVATPADIAAPRRTPAGQRSKRATPPTETALADIARLEETPSRGVSATTLMGWAVHPDERVPIALAHCLTHIMFRDTRRPFPLSRDLLRALTDRVTDINRAEGLLWNPITDLGAQVDLLRPLAYAIPEEQPSATGSLEEVAVWVRAQTDPRALHQVLQFTHPDLKRAVFSEARCFDDALLKAALRSDRYAEALARNPHTPDALAHALATWAIAERRRTDRGREKWSVRSRQVLEALAARGYHVPRALTDPLLARTIAAEEGAAHLDLLLTLPGALSGDDLETLYVVGAGCAAVERLVEHPASGPALWRDVAEHGASLPSQVHGVRYLHNTVAQHPEAQRDPFVRTILSSHPHPQIRLSVLRTATPDEARALVASLVDAEHSPLAGVVEGLPDDQIACLSDVLEESLAPWATERRFHTAVRRVPALMARADIRLALAATGDFSTFVTLVESSETATSDVRRAVAMRAERSEEHERLLDLLENPTFSRLRARLEAEDLTPLFTSVSAQTRQRALLVSPFVGASPALEGLSQDAGADNTLPSSPRRTGRRL